IQIKYEGYIKKSNEQVAKMLKMEDKKIPVDLDYDAVPSIAYEAREKLKKIRPISIGQASRIADVNPADISILLVYIEQGNIQKKYERYIKKSNEQEAKMMKMEYNKIPVDLDYDAVPSIAYEAREKLKKIRPISIGQASRIAGVNPADISILLVYIEQGNIQ